jgi:hypothetical protein
VVGKFLLLICSTLQVFQIHFLSRRINIREERKKRVMVYASIDFAGDILSPDSKILGTSSESSNVSPNSALGSREKNIRRIQKNEPMKNLEIREESFRKDTDVESNLWGDFQTLVLGGNEVSKITGASALPRQRSSMMIDDDSPIFKSLSKKSPEFMRDSLQSQTQSYGSAGMASQAGSKMAAYGILRDEAEQNKVELKTSNLTASTTESPSVGTDVEVGSTSSIHNVLSVADGTLILALERTLFAALNNSWLLALGGVGLMSIGNEDEKALYSGIAILSLSLFTAIYACTMHNFRVHQLRKGKGFSYSQTIMWGGLISVFTLVTLSLELYNGILHPYLKRVGSVTIVNQSNDIFDRNDLNGNL